MLRTAPGDQRLGVVAGEERRVAQGQVVPGQRVVDPCRDGLPDHHDRAVATQLDHRAQRAGVRALVAGGEHVDALLR